MAKRTKKQSKKTTKKVFHEVKPNAAGIDIGAITLSFLSYNIVSYINRFNHEPQTIGGLFKDLECELNSLAISMELFINIL